VKCPNVACAVAAVNALHGRWFAGKEIKGPKYSIFVADIFEF
jgi:hypothetical protein